MQQQVWIKLDDAMLDNPKIAAAGPIGFALHVAAIIYSARNLTDGFVPYGHARHLLATDWSEGEDCMVWELSAACGMHGESRSDVIEHIIRLLCELGLWDVVPHGYTVHDFLEYNPSREQVLAMRAERSESGKRGGEASAQARAKAKALREASAQALAQANSKQNSSKSPTPHPVPEPVSVGVLTPSVGSPPTFGLHKQGAHIDGFHGVGGILGGLRLPPREEKTA